MNWNELELLKKFVVIIGVISGYEWKWVLNVVLINEEKIFCEV